MDVPGRIAEVDFIRDMDAEPGEKLLKALLYPFRIQIKRGEEIPIHAQEFAGIAMAPVFKNYLIKIQSETFAPF